MSDGKRVALQSLGPGKKDKKCKTTPTTIRLNLSLPTCNSDTFADFNYNSLILHERRKKEKTKEKEKVNGLDPYASDDEDDLRQIARSFESKYGTPKKKCRRLEDYTELGTGYDENDSFIDNTDAYDEVVPEDKTPELDGFYINKGHLVLKQVDGPSSSEDSSSDESEGPPNSKSQKRPLSSESESSTSGSSDDSDDSEGSDESDDSDEDAESEDAQKEVKTSPKEEKGNGHITSPPPKKLKLGDFTLHKKVKNKTISGEPVKKSASEKDQNEKRVKLDANEKELVDKRPKFDTSDREQNEKQSKLASEGVKRISSIDAAIEAVARGEDSKESGIAESKSHSGSSDDSEMEETHRDDETGGFIAPPLPEDLPDNIIKCISDLKELALKNRTLGKQQFFTPAVNALLLRFEKLMKFVPRDKKGAIYDHLECFVPCRKETLLKRGKALLLESVETGYKEPLLKLKTGIDSLMPNALERYQIMCRKYDSSRASETPSDPSDPAKPSSEKTKIPRRRFPWTEELKELLCLAVRKRRMYFGIVKQKGEVWDDHLKEFLKNDVLPMWQTGWMKVPTLLDILCKMAGDLLQFKPSSPGVTFKESSSMPIYQKAYVVPNSKPLVSVNHQNLNCSTSLISSCDSIVKSTESHQNGTKTTPSSNSVQPSALPPVSQASPLDLLDSEIVQCIRTSLANSLVSVTPVQTSSNNNQGGNASIDGISKARNAPLSSSTIRKPLNSSVDIINLQTNGMDASVEFVQKKRPPSQSGAKHHAHQTITSDLQDLSKSQSSSSVSNVTSQASHTPLSLTTSSTHNSIKVSSVSAINLKLSGAQSQSQLPQPLNQAQTSSSKSPVSQPSKAHNQVLSVSSNSVHHASSTFNSQSVISQGLEPSSLGVSSSLTITPVKPSSSNNSYYQQAKGSGHSNASNTNSSVSLGNSNIRSDVIVTPSNSSTMPHIKSTSVNYSTNNVSSVSTSNNYSSSHQSGTNFSTSHSGSATNLTNTHGVNVSNYQSSHGTSNNSYSSSMANSDGRHHRQVNISDTQPVKHIPADKNTFAQPSRNQAANMWSSSVPVDISRSSSSSPSSVKSVTPSPEKALVSRKDRILQDSRERAGNDPAMPILSGPYRSSSVTSEQTNTLRNQPQAKATPQNLSWDDELFEDLLKMPSTIPLNTPKVSTASLDNYKHTHPILEPQRGDNIINKSSLDSLRAKNMTPISEPQRANVVMQTSNAHSISKLSSIAYTQQSRDSPRTNTIMSNHGMQRPSSAKSTSSNSDSIRTNVVMATPHFQEPLKDEMSDILAGIPTQMISRTDHYTITNSMPSHNSKRRNLPEISDVDLDLAMRAGVPTSSASRVDTKAAMSKHEESLQKAQELAMRGILMSRTNCDGNYMEEPWNGAPVKKAVSNKSSNDISDQRLSGMGTYSSTLSMTGLDGMGLGLPSHLVGYQNDYQRHLFSSSSKNTGANDHRPL
ncbi:Ubinuclein-2 [Frankliniella fusca]|uniref:Ubinuclein-2 n=1 Tax=Frankliniella fusca TaxID=407009 RepID=A0AAE1HB20_9NEOP|nr:Ubinuclein-2 [Frankliniella fusca]